MSLAKGIVFEAKRYWSPVGKAAPPDSLPDVSRFGNDGTFTTAPDWVQLSSGLWVMDFVAASNELVTVGDIGTARTLVFWLKPDSTTESILEELAATGITCSSSSMVYGSWDNCFVNGVDTNTMTTAWQHVAVTSTTDVTMSAFRLGLVDTTYLDGMLSLVRAFLYELSQDAINKIYAAERAYFGV
jgi:hypothetical protein|tara:strand:- start:12127 stop:12684 length:558 start_codon:yes stop_codon:yes gene_type:complete